jgi:phage-related protein
MGVVILSLSRGGQPTQMVRQAHHDLRALTKKSRSMNGIFLLNLTLLQNQRDSNYFCTIILAVEVLSF